MSPEARHESDYTNRQVEAARRVLVDVAQVLASFRDAIVVVGGWVPDLLLPHSEIEHIGSIDVDLALDARQGTGGRVSTIALFARPSKSCEKGFRPLAIMGQRSLRSFTTSPTRPNVPCTRGERSSLSRSC